MALNMRRALQHEIDAVSKDDCISYIVGMQHCAPDDDSVLFKFYDSWLEAHYAFSGQGWNASLPEGFILAGEDWHQFHPQHEPSKLLRADDVKAAAAHLKGLSREDMEQRLTELVTGQTDLPSNLHPDDAPYILPFDDIVAFVQTAADQGEAIVKEIG